MPPARSKGYSTSKVPGLAWVLGIFYLMCLGQVMNTVKCQTKHEASLQRPFTNRTKKLAQHAVFQERYLLHHTLVLSACSFLLVHKLDSQPQLHSQGVCFKVVYYLASQTEKICAGSSLRDSNKISLYRSITISSCSIDST